jgi:glutathione peroxidase
LEWLENTLISIRDGADYGSPFRENRRLKMIRAFAIFTATFFTAQAAALDLDTPFQSMIGGTISIAQWHGQPVLVVNTASICAFSGQYRDLQDLYDRYRDQGLIVLAIPSDDFKQELATNAEVKNFCELQYGIDMPMTEITRVKGTDAHPFYQLLQEDVGFTPRWNFNKVLIDRNGDVVETYGSQVSPMSLAITRQIDALIE